MSYARARTISVGMSQSLWAVPRDPSPFSAWIKRLAAETGGPVFAPHITLAGDVPPTEPFTVDLLGLADSDARFRCITITAARTPPLDVIDDPHLSLLYGDLPAERRAELRAAITLPLPTTIVVNEVWRVDTSGDVRNWSIEQTWPLVATSRG